MEENIKAIPPMLRLASVGSTNDYLKQNHAQLSSFQAVLAEEQTAGKGRLGRSWIAKKGDALNLSILIKPRDFIEETQALSLLCGLSVAEVIAAATGLQPGIKWPNDVLIGTKKICGILVENLFPGDGVCTVIGIGINANNEAFPEEIAEKATSLYRETGQRQDIPALAEALVACIHAAYHQKNRRERLAQDYAARCITIGRRVCAISPASEIWGVATGIRDDGALLLRTDDGEERAVCSGEVSIRTERGYV